MDDSFIFAGHMSSPQFWLRLSEVYHDEQIIPTFLHEQSSSGKSPVGLDSKVTPERNNRASPQILRTGQFRGHAQLQPQNENPLSSSGAVNSLLAKLQSETDSFSAETQSNSSRTATTQKSSPHGNLADSTDGSRTVQLTASASAELSLDTVESWELNISSANRSNQSSCAMAFAWKFMLQGSQIYHHVPGIPQPKEGWAEWRKQLLLKHAKRLT
eukprot:GHVT01074748.1.p1 GENE.GHVT01074748.1~~GHVT01074748.1.p1  ORF type:complete len:215 (-),score=19.53 GHVT01074748.1:376-1020(-)